MAEGVTLHEKMKVWLAPYCERIEITGPTRRGRECAVIDFLVIPKTIKERDENDLFDHKEVSLVGRHLEKAGAKLVQHDGIECWALQNSLFRIIPATRENWGWMLLKSTGPKNFFIEVQTVCKGRRTLPRDFNGKSEAEILAFLGMPWTEPAKRYMGSHFPAVVPADYRLITPDEMRAWDGSSVWVPTTCGGEAHAYTLRVMAKDDLFFATLAQQIRDYGYDGSYWNRRYRYLDLDRSFYFTQGYLLTETQLINRKNLNPNQTARPWTRNYRLYPLSTMENDPHEGSKNGPEMAQTDFQQKSKRV